MNDSADPEIHRIVQRVLDQALGLSRQTTKPAGSSAQAQPQAPIESQPRDRNVVAIGADHGGFELKEILKAELPGLGFDVVDVGTHSKDAVDYPDIAHEVANLVSAGKAWRGIIIDGAGIGSCIVANKIPGVRAGMAYDHSSAVNSREHNDTNVLTLGAGLLGVNLAKQIVQTWLSTVFGGGRHARRVDKIVAIEKLYLK
ncbi:MAG: ribose 5-phosphate isomerase B [Acidobacteriia bacterium]|nr:ribose 5-phosphate isomerase B [Terriglobia bacterium]